ncbi:hypothetical protein Tco_1380189 [Tanacetum coccineum]
MDLTEAIPKIAPVTLGEVSARVAELAELAELHEHDTHDLYALLEDAQDGDNMDCGGGGLCFPRGMGSDKPKSKNVKVRVNTEESAVKPEPELKNTIGCNLNPSDGPGKPNSIIVKTLKAQS